MAKKKYLIVIVVAVMIVVSVVFIITKNAKKGDIVHTTDSEKETITVKNTEPETSGAETDAEPDTITAEETVSDVNKNMNVFLITSEKTDENRVTVKVSVGGVVCISNYKLGIKFDPQILKLINYDSDLSVFSPIVNPEINDGTIIWQHGINDIIELTWASANNCTKPDNIIIIEFEILNDAVGSLPVTLSVEDIGYLNNANLVEKPEYLIDDSGIQK